MTTNTGIVRTYYDMEWKFNKKITEDKFIKMCEDEYFTIDKMEIIDYNEFIVKLSDNKN